MLLDTCVWGGVTDALEAEGHDVEWVGSWPRDPGDEEILSYAYGAGRTLVTLDKDFGELAILHGRPHCGIVRLVEQSVSQQRAVCLEALRRYGDELQRGAIVTAREGRFRIRSPG